MKTKIAKVTSAGRIAALHATTSPALNSRLFGSFFYFFRTPQSLPQQKDAKAEAIAGKINLWDT